MDAVVPNWTEYRKKTGLDPLGMQNGSINLYQRLLPGISNVTLRIRYYGFYAWLASLYAKRSGNTDLRSWQKFVRRAEALYALTAQRRGGESGMAGILWAQRKLTERGSERFEFASDADPGGGGTPYLKQAWGAYGAAYASQLFEMGVFAIATGHDVPVPSPEIGEAMAEVYAAAVGDAADSFYEAIVSGETDAFALDAFAAMTPSGIEPGGEERQVYQDMLFAGGALKRPGDLSRRSTLALVLHAARRLGRIPGVDEVRWLCYAGFDEDGQTFHPYGEPQCRSWWVYQANDLLHFAYEALLKFCLDRLEGYPTGITLASFVSDAVSTISEAAPNWPTSWADFRENTTPAANAFSYDDDASERNLVDTIWESVGAAHKATEYAAWAALKLLAILERRCSAMRGQVEADLGSLDPEGFRSLITETKFLSSIAHEDFGTGVGRIVEGRVVKRHLWVAHRKLRHQGDYTFLIEADDGRIRARADNGPVFTNPRLGPALTFLRDVHLLDENGLTAAGTTLLATL